MSNYIMDDSSARKERSLKEWREIFTISTRKAGLNISAYLGNAKVVYLPDAMGKTEVASISKEAFAKDVIILCGKRLFAKLVQENKDATVCAFLSDSSIFAEDEKEYLTVVFKKDPARYLEQIIMREDQIALSEGLKLCATKKWLDECFAMTERLGKTNMNFVLLDFSSKPAEKPAPKKKNPEPAQNDAAADAVSLKDARKIFSLSVGKDGIIITGYKGDSPDVVIPSQIGEHKVIAIKEKAFAQNDTVQNVVLPDTLVKIGSEAFYTCKNLAKINIPDSVERIDAYAFAWCTSLKDLQMPVSIRKIGGGAFIRCPGFADENGFAIYKNHLYGYYGTDTAVTVPKGVKVVDYRAFHCMDKIREIILPDKLKTIEYHAFQGCTSLQRINLPESLTAIETGAFYDCKMLVSLEIPADVKNLQSGTFYGCESLENIRMGGATEILGFPFLTCNKLTIHAPAASSVEAHAKELDIPFVAE